MLTSDAKWIIQHKPQMTRERRLQCERTTGPLRPPLFQRGFVVTVPAAKMTRHSVSLGAARQPLVQQQAINTHFFVESANQNTHYPSPSCVNHVSVLSKRVAPVRRPLTMATKNMNKVPSNCSFVYMETQLDDLCPRHSTANYNLPEYKFLPL